MSGLEGLKSVVVVVNVRGIGGVFELILLSDHVVVTFGLAGGKDKGHLSVIEVTVVGVNGETSDLEFYLLDDGLSHIRAPSEACICTSNGNCGESNFKNDILEEISRSCDLNGNSSSEVSSSRDSLLNTFY